MPPGSDVLALARRLQEDARAAGHRRLLVLAGEAAWGRELAASIADRLAPGRLLWLGVGPRAVPVDAAARYLGQEVDWLVYDARAGFHPDGFAAVCGTPCGGSLVVLLAWPLDAWRTAPDPAQDRLAIHPVTPDGVDGRFLERLAALIRAHPVTTLVTQDGVVPVMVGDRDMAPSKAAVVPGSCRTLDQAAAVVAIRHVMSGHRRRPLVMIADRGRGKSAALGISVAGLFRDGLAEKVALTAPRRAAVDAVFHHAAQLLDGAGVYRNRLRWAGRELVFVAPDALVEDDAEAAPDLLLVDEAAALPAPLLERLVRRYARLVFSTTVHGYEGSGRGFAVRFGETLDRLAPGWQSCHLDVPVRWAPHDPLEDLLFRALLLDAEPCVLGMHDIDGAGAPERLDRGLLARDDDLLRQVFGLLVAAHYRTSPLDLRHLLDGPNLEVWVVRRDNRVLATALVAEEGGFDADLARAVWSGRRRPRGHLLPQVLALHAGLEEAASARALRIIRIAVHPAARRRGIGRGLVDAVMASGQARGADLVGASFAATPGVIAFWAKTGMQPASIGSRAETSTGAHSAVMLRPLSAAGRRLAQATQDRFVNDLPWHLGDALAGLDPAVLAAVVASTPARRVGLSKDDTVLLEGFARESRPFEHSRAALWRLGAAALGAPRLLDRLTENARNALVARVLQARPWAEAARMAQASGRSELVALLRTVTEELLASLESGSDLSGE
jgi:tRNA(Met) cytidine acetyltransferase